MSKPKVGFYWCAACGGCEESVVDLAAGILDVVGAVDIVFWPVALDFKREDVEKMQDKEMAVCFINGAIRSSEQGEMVELLRKKAGLVIAFGSCSHMGGIPGLANLYNKEQVMKTAYKDTVTTVNDSNTYPVESHKVPEGNLTLPSLWNTVKTLDQVIDVDYYIPGCPPPSSLLADAVNTILQGKLPAKGSVLAPDTALCHECPRKASKPEKVAIKEFKRPHEVIIDEEKCLLAQGLLCLGSATRSGCGWVCINGNMPCTGCMGPISRVHDHGTKALSAIASLTASNDEAEIAAILDKIVDPAGTFFRYSLPASLLHRKYEAPAEGGK
ncbi:NADH ubiquinone oxidoreductase 20 kDa subunit [Candidatus Zixiibacteriota bacterium]|nr:NADH ubiquinone oxidoreductase 20 kDa subunit [candidate division Zixibacteria bacterium]